MQPSMPLSLVAAVDRARSAGTARADLLEAYVRRADRLESRLRAWAALDPDGARRAVGTVPADAPLAGVPIGVKDVIDAAGLATRAGSDLTSPEPAEADAAVVRVLRDAGAVVLGKTACTEWALNDPAPTVNPWRHDRTPGGSSAGSAVAVAAGMCAATVDTQTAGDTLRPAAFNGVVGFKPTHQSVSRDGVLPVAWSIDTVGVTVRRAADAALLWSILAPAGALDGGPLEADTVDALGEVAGGRPPRLGLVHDPFYKESGGESTLSGVVARLEAAGATVVPVEPSEDLATVYATHRVVTFAECAALHESRFAEQSGRYGPRAVELIQQGLLTPAVAYLQAQRVRRGATTRLAELFADVDALLTPVTQGPAPDRATTGDPAYQIPWTFCGFPSLALPTGLSRDGLPESVQLVADHHADTTLLAVAQWCERVLDVTLEPPLPG